LLQAGSYLEPFTAATAAAAKIFVVIDRIPSIDIFSSEGDEPNANSGEIKFEDVHFSYPSRPDGKVNTKADIRLSLVAGIVHIL